MVYTRENIFAAPDKSQCGVKLNRPSNEMYPRSVGLILDHPFNLLRIDKQEQLVSQETALVSRLSIF